MAVLCILSGEGFTKEQYEEIKKEVDWEHNQPKGEIFHAIGFGNSGTYHVVESSNKTNFIAHPQD
jgi:hypothetical protein